jgi:two-component system response regulator (stage 0 sporulation protein F)
MMKIMVVDDEKDVEFLFRQEFRKEIKQGLVDLCYAFSGSEALDYLQQQIRPTSFASCQTSTCRG